MARTVWPRLFEMEMITPLVERFLDTQRRQKIERLGLDRPIPQSTEPVALRWRMTPDVGFPRQPFRVWRRERDNAPKPRKVPVGNGLYNNSVMEWGRTRMMQVQCKVTPNGGAGVQVLALDEYLEPIPGEVIAVPVAGGTIRFHRPNICALQVNGSANFSDFIGITMNEFVNSENWDLIEIVGLPYEVNETPAAVYDSAELQGHPANLLAGKDAAKERLLLGMLLHDEPDPTIPGGGPAPNWLMPSEADVMNEIRFSPEGPLELISKMLDSVNPNDPVNNQAAYEYIRNVNGISQPGSGASGDPSEFGILVAPMFLLSAATESISALGLGFGCTDFPPYAQWGPGRILIPNKPWDSPYDYMSTVIVDLPFGLKLDFAAVAAPALVEPTAPQGLNAATYLRNRGIQLDDPGLEDIQVQWDRLPHFVSPHAFAIGIAEGGNPPQILNQKRLLNGYVPFVPAVSQDADLVHEARVDYFDTARPIPAAVPRTDTYMVAAVDVFGRWGSWEKKDHQVDPLNPYRPEIQKVEFELDVPSALGRNVPATLAIEFSWDWEDRGPKEIHLRGRFFAPPNAPAGAAGGMQLTAGGPAGAPFVLQFNDPVGGGQNEIPTLTSGVGTVQILPSQPDDGEVVRYRLEVFNVDCDFSAATRLYYAAYARASEKIDPATFSNFTEPKTGQAIDPLPAAPPTVVPDLYWTAAPDATGFARYKVSFPSVPHATGYVIYEASEAAMRKASGLATYSDEDSLGDRTLQLMAVAAQPALQDTFSRINTKLLPTPEIEVELPGSVDGLFAYNFASMTGENVQSERSGIIYVGVPRRSDPGPPVLSAKGVDGVVKIEAEPGPGPFVEGFELYRARSPLLITDVNKMGLPIIEADDPNWTPVDKAGDPPMTGDRPDHFRIEDTPTPSWFPWYYRAIAVGVKDVANGMLPGRSRSSAVIDVKLFPPDPPDLQPLVVDAVAGNTLFRVRFRSSAEYRVTPPGVHTVKISTVNRSGPMPVYTEHVKKILPDTVAPGSPVTEAVGDLTRTDKDVNKRWLYETYVPITDEEVVVRIIDPLERYTELRAELELPPPPPPPDPPDLVDLTWNRTLFWLTIAFKSSAPIVPPAPGQAHLVETFDADGTPWDRLNMKKLHEITTSGGLGNFKRSNTTDGNGRYTYTITRCIWFRSISTVGVRMTDPDSLVTELSN